MKRSKKSVIVPMVIASTFGWAYFTSEAIKVHQLEEVDKPKLLIEDIKSVSLPVKIKEKHQYIHDEYERLKEEERKRLAELERQRLEKIEQERLAELARIEAEKKKQQAVEEAKKKALTSNKEIVYNDNGGGWMTFNGSYYGANCYLCSGVTAVGIDVRNTIYYDGLRIIALDPKVIPLWSIVEVKTPNESFKALVADTGGRIKGRNADILVESEEVSRQYGRHNIQLRVIGKYNK